MSTPTAASGSPTTRTSARLFFTATFAWSAFFWAVSTPVGGIDSTLGSLLFYAGGAGPVIAALAITHGRESRAVQRDLWSRTFNVRRVPVRWFIAALVLHPAILAFAVLADLATGGTLERQGPTIGEPLALLQLVVLVFVLGPLPEQMGWRGVAYERLVGRMSAVRASLWLGVAWAVWHVPLFFIEGTFHAGLGVGSPRFWIFLLSNIPLTVLMTWVYVHTDRSTLAVVLVHFSGNIVGALLVKTTQLALFELIGLTLAAVALVVTTGSGLGAAQATDPH